jgi:Tfp pilus assembly protein PilN
MLAAKALSRGDPRFYPIPKFKDLSERRHMLFEFSIAGIALVFFALIMGSIFTARYVQQSREHSALTIRIAELQEVTQNQMTEQNSYRAQSREVFTQNKTLDSLLSSTKLLEPVLDTLCRQGRKIGNFWLTDLDWSYDDMMVSGVALKRERVDDIARILNGARLMSVATEELGGRTIYPFALMIPLSSDK